METIIYLIRHAQSQPSERVHYSEWPLSPVGLGQAAILCDLLEPLGIEMMFSSPYTRCLQTVQPYVDKAGIEMPVNYDIREQTMARQFIVDFDVIWRRSWDDFNFALPGCETSSDAQQRFVAAVNDILAEPHDLGTIGVSTHGQVLGLFLNYLDRSFGREQAQALKNPDVVRIVAGDRLMWDRDFRLPGLDSIATDHRETPVPGRLLE